MISSRLLTDKTFKNQIMASWNEDSDIDNFLLVSTDTRQNSPGSIFFAIKGERIDPFSLLDEIIARYCVVIFHYSEENIKLAEKYSSMHRKIRFYAVKDSVEALQVLARLHVEDWYTNTTTHHLIAISGSNGKTTTKEMLHKILSGLFQDKVTATLKNNNNHIGVPLTLFQIHCRTTLAAVVEFGSNHPGEIKVISDIAQPNAGIVTNIGLTHMEFFKDTKDVFLEEGLIYQYVNKNKTSSSIFLINDDDEYLKNFADTEITKRFSTTNENADFFYKIDKNCATLVLKNNGTYKFENGSIMGQHNFLNMCNAISLANHLFPGRMQEILKYAEEFRPTPNRSEWKMLGDLEIFLDAYNANPSSMKVALSEFIEHVKVRNVSADDIVVVIGEMKELGERSKQYHIDFFKWVSGLSLPNLLYVGDFAQEFQTICPSVKTFGKVEDAREYFSNVILKKKFCFIKASRSLQLERLLDITKG